MTLAPTTPYRRPPSKSVQALERRGWPLPLRQVLLKRLSSPAASLTLSSALVRRRRTNLDQRVHLAFIKTTRENVGVKLLKIGVNQRTVTLGPIKGAALQSRSSLTEKRASTWRSLFSHRVGDLHRPSLPAQTRSVNLLVKVKESDISGSLFTNNDYWDLGVERAG